MLVMVNIEARLLGRKWMKTVRSMIVSMIQVRMVDRICVYFFENPAVKCLYFMFEIIYTTSVNWFWFPCRN